MFEERTWRNDCFGDAPFVDGFAISNRKSPNRRLESSSLTSPGRRCHMVNIQLEDAESYKILSQSGCTTLDGVDDAAEFGAVKAAFDTIGMEDEAQTQV